MSNFTCIYGEVFFKDVSWKIDGRWMLYLPSLKVWWTLSEIHNEMVSPQSLNFDIFECFFHLFSLLFTIWANGRANWWCRTNKKRSCKKIRYSIVTQSDDTYMNLDDTFKIYFRFFFSIWDLWMVSNCNRTKNCWVTLINDFKNRK